MHVIRDWLLIIINLLEEIQDIYVEINILLMIQFVILNKMMQLNFQNVILI
jgi:hypothetical protein